MAKSTMCTADRKDGIAICKTHDVKLVDRATLESLGIKLEHPPVGNIFCPVSGQGSKFVHEADEFLGA